MPRKQYNPEKDIQKACLKYLASHYPQGMATHYPAGVLRSTSEARRLKYAGARRGVPDLFVLRPRGLTAWIEIKTPTGDLTTDQIAFLDWLVSNGHEAHVVRSEQAMVDLVEKWNVQDKSL